MFHYNYISSDKTHIYLKLINPNNVLITCYETYQIMLDNVFSEPPKLWSETKNVDLHVKEQLKLMVQYSGSPPPQVGISLSQHSVNCFCPTMIDAHIHIIVDIVQGSTSMVTMKGKTNQMVVVYIAYMFTLLY